MDEPPLAALQDHLIRSPHGTRNDPYFWLRDDTRADPRVLDYLKLENAYTARWHKRVAGLEATLYQEILARVKQDDSSVPYRKNGYWYYTRYETGQEYPIHARKAGSLNAPEQILLDVNALARGRPYFQIGSFEVSPDGQWLAYCEDGVGRREYCLRFKHLATGQTLPTSIADVETDIAWADDNKTVLYVAKDPRTLLGIYVKKHVVGTSSADDVVLFEQTDKSFYTSIARSKSDRFIFLGMENTISSEWRYAEAGDPALQFKTFLPHEPDHEYQIDHVGEEFIIRSNWNARNFRLMRVAMCDAADRNAWRDLIAHRDDTFIYDFDVFARFVAVSERSGGLLKIRIAPFAGESTEPFCIASEEAAYATAIGANPEIHSTTLRYHYTSMTTPLTVYDFEVFTAHKTLLKRDVVLGEFDPADYCTEFLFAPARDGRLIPVSLVYRRGLERNAGAPLLQYAYGAYGHSVDPAFSASRLSLLDRGFVFAIAHVRGGQEMGRAWYDEGRLLHKHNSFNDFIDVTHYLTAQGYAARNKVFAMGGSAGGLLMGAIANLAPQDYRGIVAQVPFVDVLTTMQDDGVPLTTNEYDEWGNPQERQYYDYMLGYSPYDNVRAQSYPAMLVTTGLWDSQVQYYEPAKWVAKLRQLKTDSNLLLLHVEMKAGHGGKSGRFEHYREIAREYAFILDRLAAP